MSAQPHKFEKPTNCKFLYNDLFREIKKHTVMDIHLHKVT